MAEQIPGDITLLLEAVQGGDRAAFDRLVPLVYDELHRRAHWHRVRAGDETLSTTALVHETYLKLLESSAAVGENRRHFFNVAAQAMRQIVVDYARRRTAAKRGGGAVAVALDEVRLPPLAPAEAQAEEILALHDALTQLDALAPRLARVVELRFFVGLSVEETAEILGVTDRTIKRDWRKARAFLFERVAPESLPSLGLPPE